MDRSEAVLRELKLYPQWVRRNQPAPVLAEQPAPITPEAEAEAMVPAAVVASTHLAPPLAPGEACPEPCRRVEEPAQAKINDIHADSSVAVSASQADKLNWPELKQRVHDCTACKLRAGCTQTVFGVGDEQAEWLFVDEGPGADEDAQGEPFVGQAGKLLDNMLLSIKLRRVKNVYIANIVKCRPPNNRVPEAGEIATCLPYLQRQIELIKPKLIVALGKTAATALLGRDAPLGSLRGTLHDYRGIPLVVTYHPAYLLRSPMEKAKAWQDLCFAVQEMQKL
ncbi:MAG: uracil-DNA glycosylase [Gallionella sp.]|nr:uracil-DNA glycosylase [Gallionella sp.]